jgi:hypothetical protein
VYKRAVANYGDLMCSTIGKELPFDSTGAEVVLHLVARDALIPECRLRRAHLRDTEVADTDKAGLPSCDKRLQCAHGLLDRYLLGQ